MNTYKHILLNNSSNFSTADENRKNTIPLVKKNMRIASILYQFDSFSIDFLHFKKVLTEKLTIKQLRPT